MRRWAVMLGGMLPVLALSTVADAAPAPPNDEKWALVVVVNKYKPPTKPAGGPRDAPDFQQVLTKNGWPEDHIRVLTDQAATAANIRAGMAWLAERSTETSFSVFHFSGHVKQKRGDMDRDGEDIDEFLWDWGNQFISDAELADRMRAVKGDTWVDISGCEAGGFDDGISGPRRLFTGSSQETENSYSYRDGGSVFTELIVRDALLGGAGDSDGNGVVSLQEAFEHARRHAPDRTSTMSNGPQTPHMAGGDGSPWYLQPPAPAPAGPAGTCVAGICLPPPVPALPVPQLPVVGPLLTSG